MYFTKKAYYQGDIFIPNLNEECDNLDFYGYEAEKEEECLRFILGDCLYNELVTQLEWDDSAKVYKLKDSADEKWDWLINGRSYTSDDITDNVIVLDPDCDSYTWDGFTKVIDRRIPDTIVNGETAQGIKVYRSFISDYVYYMWSLNTDTFTASTGEKTSDVKNTFQASNSDKRIKAYNRFVSWVSGYGHGNVGLYVFMQHFKSLYPEWDGKPLKYEPIW